VEVAPGSRLSQGMHTHHAVAVAVAVLVTTALGLPAAPGHAVEPAPALVLYQQQGRERAEVALIRSDGTAAVNPVGTLGTGDQSNPDWAPGGRRFVFAMNDGRRDDLWVARTDGTHARRLLDCRKACRYLDDPAWSPDGREVGYSRTSRGPGGSGVSTLEVVDVRTGHVRVLLGPWTRRSTAGVRWAPSGGDLVFERVHKVSGDLDAAIDGVSLVRLYLHFRDAPRLVLTDPRLFAATADWSPDGNRIVYSALPEPGAAHPDLFVIGIAGGGLRRITNLADDGGYAVEPTWLPDSTGIVFSGRADGSPGEPMLLTVQDYGSGLGSAFGDDIIHGRHPRVRPR